MIAARIILAFGIVWLLGALALGHASARRRGMLGFAADFATGVVLLAFVGSVAVIMGVRLSPVVVYTLIAGLAGAAAVRRIGLRVSLDLPRDAVARSLLAATALPVLLLGVSSLGDRLWWDGWAIWVLKARILFIDGTLPAAYFEPGGTLAFSHPGYPLAVPLLDWWLFRHAGTPDPAIASLAGTVWYAILTFAVYGALHERAGERVAALAALGTALFWPIAFYATGGTADVVIALALLGAIREMANGITGRDAAAIWRCGVFLALGTLAKAEGIAVAGVVGGVAVISLIRARALRPTRALALALPFVVLAPWHLFVTRMDVGRNFFTFALTPAELIDRVMLVSGAMVDIAIQPAWLPVVGLTAMGMLKRSSNEAWSALAGYIGAVAVSYLLTPLDPRWLVDTSLARVLAACVPAALCVSLSGVIALAAPGIPAEATSSASSLAAVQACEVPSPDRPNSATTEVGVETHAPAN